MQQAPTHERDVLAPVDGSINAMLIDRKEQPEGFAFGNLLHWAQVRDTSEHLCVSSGAETARSLGLPRCHTGSRTCPPGTHCSLQPWNAESLLCQRLGVLVGHTGRAEVGSVTFLLVPKAPGKKGQRQAVATAMRLNTASQTAVMAACTCTWWPAVHTSWGANQPLPAHREPGQQKPLAASSACVSSLKQHPTGRSRPWEGGSSNFPE